MKLTNLASQSTNSRPSPFCIESKAEEFCAIAKVLGETKHASLLEQTLEEETETDEKLTELAEKINTQANEEGPRKEQGESKPGVKTTKRVA